MSDNDDRPWPAGAAKFATALQGMSPDPQATLDACIAEWAARSEVPLRDETRSRIACAMFAALAIRLQSMDPEVMGWLGLKNEDFAKRILETMTPAGEDDPPGTFGRAELHVRRKGELVFLEYTPEVGIALPTATARQLAEALLTVAGEIEGTSFMVMKLTPGERR